MEKITDRTEVQFRQINPNWIIRGELSFQAFIPMTKDEGKVSFDRSELITAKQSHVNYCKLGLESIGVYGVTTGECKEEPYSIECFASPLENNQHHSHADFNGLSKSERRAKARLLLHKAIARGKLHP